MKQMNQLDVYQNITLEVLQKFAPIFIFLVVMFFVAWLIKKPKKVKSQLKKATKEKAHGIIFGKKRGKRIFSPEIAEQHIGVFSASGTGKTASIGIPTLRTWRGTSFVIDISGDIEKNCPNMPHKLIFCPENEETNPFNIFGPIDVLDNLEDKHEALEQLAFLLMPSNPSMNDNAKFFHDNGRKILTASFIAFYDMGMDFIDICSKIVSTSWKTLFADIDKTQNHEAIIYINGFEGASSQNTAGCKQACDDALKLFATNAKIKRAIRRPHQNENAIEPKAIEKNNLFIVVHEDKLALYAPLMNIITSQIMQYIGTRKVNDNSKTILLFLDEFGSLGLDAGLILDAVRRFRKRKCRIMLLMQNTVDMTILYGEDVTRAILSNLHFKVLLGGLGEPESQKYFADLIGYKTVKRNSTSKSDNQTTYTESDSKEYVIEPADLDRQGKHTVIVINANEPNGYIKLRKNYYFKK